MKKLSGSPIRICAAAHAKHGIAPADRLKAPSRERPSNRARKSRKQCNAGDRLARIVAVDPPQRAERRVVKAAPHADAEQDPGDDQYRDRGADTKQSQSGGQRQIGRGQHRPAAEVIDLAPDARTDDRRDHQRGGKGGKDPVRGDAEVTRDRIG